MCMRGLALLPLLMLTGCTAFDQGPQSLKGSFGGPHIGVDLEGGLGMNRFHDWAKAKLRLKEPLPASS